MVDLVPYAINHVDPAKIVASKKPSLRRMVERACNESPNGLLQTYDYEDLATSKSTKIGFSHVDIFPSFKENTDNRQVEAVLNKALQEAGNNIQVLSYEPTRSAISVNSFTGKVLGSDGNYYFLKIPKVKDASLLSEAQAKEHMAPYLTVEYPRLILSTNDSEVGLYPWHDKNTLNYLLRSVTEKSSDNERLWKIIKKRNWGFGRLFVDSAKNIAGSSHNEASVHNLYHRRLLTRPSEWYSKNFINISGNPFSFNDIQETNINVNGTACGKFGEIHHKALYTLNPYSYPQTVVALGLGDMHGNNSFVDEKKSIEFDYGNTNYHWPWLDIAKDLHVNVCCLTFAH